jgi:hypothetical protein
LDKVVFGVPDLLDNQVELFTEEGKDHLLVEALAALG